MSSETVPRYAVLIPAYRPSPGLVGLVRALSEKGTPAIVVVDDGSGPEYREIFAQAANFPHVQLLRHATNLGKGAALKTGINVALCTFPGLLGVVTADADGQHHPDDIERVAQVFLERPDSLVLGSRSFDKDVPLRSRFGNVATRGIMHALLGQKLTDTQTGLRGIPTPLLMRMLRVESTGYEFELEMLIAAHHMSIPVVEQPIQTIYEPGNKSSHFNPIVDSMKIYFVLLRFGSVSFVTALLDNLVFILARHYTGSVLVSQIIGRACAVTFNYSTVRGSVFYSKQSHRTVLPKYLGLVILSGSVSYAGIRLLSAKTGMDPVPAKLLVETLLFFVNFAAQRIFIFKPGEGSNGKPGAARPEQGAQGLSWLVSAVLIVAVAIEVYGFATGNLFHQEIWSDIGLKRFGRFAGMYVSLALPVLILVPWTFAALVSGLTLLATVAAIGPVAALAVIYFLLSACALGTRILGRIKDQSGEAQLGATLLGIGVYIFLMTLLARVPIHFMATWIAILSVPLLLDRHGVWSRIVGWGAWLRDARLCSKAERATFALLVFVLLAHWFVALTPESSADALAMHLAIPINIANHHALTFQPARFLWATMPIGADYTYTIAYLLGGEYAAHLMDYAALLLVVGLIYSIVRHWLTRAAAFLLAALFATTPLVYLVTGSLFVENVLAAMVLGFFSAFWRFAESGERKYLYLAAALGGTALSVKVGALSLILVALPFVVWEVRRCWKLLSPRPWAACALATAIFLVAALPTYAAAWWKTGNPVFPYQNQRFHSRLLDPSADIQDVRFRHPLSWNTPYDLTFRTTRTYEGQNGSFGFQYLPMALLALAAIFLVKRRAAKSAAVVALGAALIVMSTEPNARYLYAALPLLSVPFAALLEWAGGRRWLYGALIGVALLCAALNLYFLPSSSYYHKDFCLRLPFSRAERERIAYEPAPIRGAIAYYDRAHPGSTVLLATGEGSIAGLEGEIYENHWHQFATLDRLRRAKGMPETVQLLQDWKVQYLIAHKLEPGESFHPVPLRDLLEHCAVPEFESGEFYVARFAPACDHHNPYAQRVAVPALPTVVVPPGAYDDFDPAILYHGDWSKSKDFEGPDHHTISFADAGGAEVLIAFQGSALTYVFTRAPNRGVASITIDGVPQDEIDLYSPKIEWQTRHKFCCLGAGRHLAVVRVAGRNDPKSSGQFIDLDSFVVE